MTVAGFAAAVLLSGSPPSARAVVENQPVEEDEPPGSPPLDAYRPAPEGPLGNDRPVDDFFDSNYFPLNWPALAFESVSKPVIWTVEFIDRYRIHRRVYDLLTNDERTAAIYPFLSFGNEGLNSVGIRAFHKNLFDARKVVRFAADWDMDRSWTERFRYTDPSVAGGHIYAHFDQKMGRYKDMRFYGIGNDSLKADRYSFRSDYESVELQGGYGKGRGVGVGLKVNFERSDTRPETALGIATAGMGPEELGALESKKLIGVGGVVRFDRRRWRAETLEGYRLLASVSHHIAPGPNRSRFVKWSADGAWFQPLFRRGRILVIRAFIESAHDVSGGTIALFDLPSLGGDSFLRGFPAGRFRDRTVMAFTQEYRFPVWRFVDFTVFADQGKAMRGLDRMSFSDMHLSWGAGIRGRRQDLFLWRFVFAQSREGIRLNFSLSQEY